MLTILLGLAGLTIAGAGIVEMVRRHRRQAGLGRDLWAVLLIGTLAVTDLLFLLSYRAAGGRWWWERR
jgi:hypothetical protein